MNIASSSVCIEVFVGWRALHLVRYFALAIVFLVASQSRSQDVRPMLRFGMTAEQATLALQKYAALNSMDFPQARHPKMYVPISLRPVVINGLVGETHLIFSVPEKRLSWINTNLHLQSPSKPGHFEATKWKFIDAFMKKHGKPTGINGCKNAADDCTLIWSLFDQRLEFMAYSKGAIILNYLAPGFRESMK